MSFTLHLGLESVIPTALYISGILVFLLSVTGRPRLGLYYIIPLLPLQTVRYQLHQFPMGSLLVDWILLGVFIGLRRDGYLRFTQTGFGKVLVGFIVFTYVGLWKGVFYLDTNLPLTFSDSRLQDWKNYMVMPLMVFLVAAAFEEVNQIKLLMMLMCLSVLMLDKFYMGTVSGRDFSQFSYESRYAGAMGYAGVNGFAAFEAQFSTFLLGLSAFERRLPIKLAVIGVVAFNLYCLLFSLSRGGYAAVLVGIGFIALLKSRLLFIPLVLFLTSWQTLVPPAVRERIFMTHNEQGEIDSSAGDRLSLWEDAVTLFKSDPITGTGFNTYSYLHRLGYGDTHNYYLKILVETGVVGLWFFLYIVWKMIYHGLRLWREAEDKFLSSLGLGFAGLMVCAVVANLFGDRWTYLQVSGYTWTLLGLVYAGRRIGRDSDEMEYEAASPESECLPVEV